MGRTGHLERDRQNRTSRTGQSTGQAEQDRRTGQAEKDRQKRTSRKGKSRTGQTEGNGLKRTSIQDRQNLTGITGQAEHDIQNGTVRTRHAK
jgi:hypothetical protein